jgi:type I restriction enzyme S subunit
MAGDFVAATFQDLIDDGVLEIGDGYRAQNNELGGSGPIFLRAGHVTDSHIDFAGVERFHLRLAGRVAGKMSRPGDTVVTTKGNSTGRTSFVTEVMPEFVYSPHLSYWRSRDPARLDSRFVRYWSRGREFGEQLAGMKASTDMAPYLSLTDQRRLRITLPPVPEQNRIAHILGTLDDKMELNRRMNATLEGISRAIFKSWFVDFDPVRQKAAGQQPVGMDAETAALFPDSFEDSEIGKVPRGWMVEELREVVAFSRASVEPAEFPDESFDHYSIPAFDAGRWPAVDKGATVKSQKFLVPDECVLISKLNPSTPRVWIPGGGTGRRAIASTEFLVTLPDTARGIGVAYIALLAGSVPVVEYLTTHASGTSNSHQRVRPDDLLDYRVALPPRTLLEAFQAVVDPILDSAGARLVESNALATLRDTLLPKLLSGEIRVPEAEEAVEEVIG